MARLKEPYNKRVWFVARQRARENGLEFTITPDDIVVPTHCPVLGIELKVNRKTGGLDNSPSIDRLDNTKGYTPDNVWIISNLANAMKSSATVHQLQTFAKWVFARFPLRLDESPHL